MTRYWLYIHTCPNGKRYVGVTTYSNPNQRWRNGNGYRRNSHFYNAILKYGWDNIDHQVWELSSVEDMYYGEKYLIAFYQTNKREYGYNKSSGGEYSNTGCRHSNAKLHFADYEDAKAYQKAYDRLRNATDLRKEYVKEYNKQYRLLHKDELNAYQRARYAAKKANNHINTH